MYNDILLLQVTIDISPPHAGTVFDSLSGSPDLDFQPSFIHQAHWSGFLDKESGVMFYQYGFSERCIPADEFVPGSTNVCIWFLCQQMNVS